MLQSCKMRRRPKAALQSIMSSESQSQKSSQVKERVKSDLEDSKAYFELHVPSNHLGTIMMFLTPLKNVDFIKDSNLCKVKKN